MSRKRAVLEQLKRDELVAALDRFELDVEDRRVRDDLVNTLAGSRRAGLAEILGDLSRDRLKEICRELGVDARPLSWPPPRFLPVCRVFG
jgi:type I restriction enzyme M protein